ncbi:Glycogen debranching enzyme [Thelohanellus kitauei]|uniref:Glycogen debranching enzyme n=1 Tax=Thelohanellus kitauei TaxID=669202 RepID=A0A0C2MJT8_THEKT|nr:Glycogen debranching enzyme [Thelohanellus kitauei]
MFDKIYDQNLHGITFSSINDILFKSKEEECDDFLTPIYNVPNLGELLYQGLYGLEIVFSKIRQTNDIGHPLCQNLRDGYWLMDHILNRIRHRSINPQFVELLESLFELCKYLPNFLVPCYFEASNREIINLLVNFAFSRMNQKLLDYDHFVRKLCLSTVDFVNGLQNLKPPRSPHEMIQQLPAYIDPEIIMSAGLPHYSCSCSRIGSLIILFTTRTLLFLGMLWKQSVIAFEAG